MATRGAIARLERRESEGQPPVFRGNYHHWDSYPTGLGKTLWGLYHGHFQQDLELMLQTLIDNHPAGWSSIVAADFTKSPGFVETMFQSSFTENKAVETVPAETVPVDETVSMPDTAVEESLEEAACNNGACYAGACDEGLPAPACYCHGDREEAPWQVTEANAAASGIEWVYAFSEGLMHILSSFTPTGEKMIGMFGQGDPRAGWRTVAVIDLDEEEPDWQYIEETAHLVPEEL
jgi:hypothetical protein